MPTALITGANRGLGLGFARSLAVDRWQVHACCRHPDKASELGEIEGVQMHRLDVSDGLRVASLARELADVPIDLLINNAGIPGPEAHFGSHDYDDWLQLFAVNSIAPMRMAERFVEQVTASKRKMIVNISSRLGSIGENKEGDFYPFRSSKAALNMITKGLSVDLAERGICVVALHPGWVHTEAGGEAAPLSVEDSVHAMRELLDRLTLEDSGKFLAYDGSPIPW